jgi:tetratricopeptide (TPR) repeat protein
MRRILLVAFTLLFAIVAVVAVISWRGRGRERLLRLVAQAPGPQTPLPARAGPETPPQPDISLQIDRKSELTVYQATPLIITVRIANHRAINAAVQTRTNQIHAEALRAAVASGKILKEKADPLLASFQQPEQIESIQLGDGATAWDTFVRFAQLLPDGKQQPLGWALRAMNRPEATRLTLDADTVAQLDYALDSSAAAVVAPGEYQIVALVEVPAEGKIPSDRWQGRVESEPVRLRIAERATHWQNSEQEKLNLDLAYYDYATGDWRSALEHAQKAIAANPHSVHAAIVVGQAKEKQGDLKGALAAYQMAESKFYAQYPKSEEPPLYLIYKTTSLMQKLGGQP